MANFPFLSRLKQQDQGLSFPEKGKWINESTNAMKKLSASLDVDVVKSSRLEVDAIPDVWARPLLFGEALYKDTHPLHWQVMGEWRGLLALLALREIRGFNISTKSISFSEQASTNLERTLASLLPSPDLSFSADTNWKNLYIIYLSDNPIGITSPYTMVSTATDYSYVIGGVEWFDGKHFGDPIKYLNRNEIEGLGKWLTAILSELANKYKAPRNPEFRTNIFRVMKDYIHDLENELGSTVGAEKPNYGFKKLDMSYGAYELLNEALVGDRDDIATSHVLLKSSPGKSPGKEGLVVDATISKAWNRMPSDVVIIGTTTLAQLGYDRTKLNLNDNYQQIIPAELFTEKLYVTAESPNNLPGVLRGRDIRGLENLTYQRVPVVPILPIRRELLDYLNNADLAAALEFQTIGEGIRVKITLPLSGGEFTVEKEYKTDQGQIARLENLPVIEIWPNIKDPNWRAFYTFYSGKDITETFYVTPLDSSEMELEQRTIESDRNGIQLQISKTTRFPEVLLCKVENKDIGILLLKEPDGPRIAQSNKSWNIGIDFGTTGTNAFICEEGSIEPRSASLSNRRFHVTEPGTVKVQAFKYFIQDQPDQPDGKVILPFQSIFNPFALESIEDKLRPLLEGNIYFHPNVASFKDLPNLIVDLKWSELLERRKYIRVFLTQLCLQLCVEAKVSGVNKINWSFSYPTAFSPGNKNAFYKISDNSVADCTKMAGMGPGERSLQIMTESVAAACYFSSDLKAPLSRGAVCLDIGGGTTDISIWQASSDTGGLPELKWQTSLKLAARDLLIESIRKKITILDLIRKAGGINIGTDISAISSIRAKISDFYAQADAMILRNSAEILEALPLIAGEPEFKEFVGVIALGLSGLYHYVGLLLRELYLNGKYEPRMPNIYIGGNGSQLFKWVSSGNYKASSSVNKLFRLILEHSFNSNLTESFEIKPSGKLKSEVAYGLVCEKTHFNPGNDDEKQKIIAGEGFSVLRTGATYQWNTNLTAEHLTGGIRVEKGLPEFSRFLNVYNSNCEKVDLIPMPFSGDMLNQIVDRLNHDYSQLTAKENDSIAVEPIFVQILKKYLEMKTDAWEQNG